MEGSKNVECGISFSYFIILAALFLRLVLPLHNSDEKDCSVAL